MKVLVAENNQEQRQTLVKYLEEENITVVEATSGTNVLELWSAELPNVLILDINLENGNTRNLIEEIRKREQDSYTYIIVATDDDDQVIISDSYEVGADDYISMPIRKTELIYRLKASSKVIGNSENQYVIYALAQLTETRDLETGKHLERIGAYAKVLATELKNNPKYSNVVTNHFINNLALSAVLHDIGKVGIEDAILRKQGLYTKEERMAMQQHTLLGHKTIMNIQEKYPFIHFLHMAAEIARSHHEKFDGTGYPDNLSGTDIPLSARIVALADVFDALISERVYKPKYSFEESKRIILESSGSHFDPDIVQAFLKNEDKFYEIALNDSLLEVA